MNSMEDLSPMSQSTSHIFMIRPHSFRMNEETAENNFYQKSGNGQASETIIEMAQQEFEGLVNALENEGIHVLVFDESEPYETPDALFPNNWISTHENGAIALFPMFAPNRRKERREDIPLSLEHDFKFDVQELVDFTEFEEHQKFLEGTGSIVLDRVHRKAYAALSARTDERALHHFCAYFDYEPIAFVANQTINNLRLPIYHTNVMMSIGSQFAAICLDSIDDLEERAMVKKSLMDDGHDLIELAEEQINQFAGNMLELQGQTGTILVMSSAAFRSLDSEQIGRLENHAKLVHSDLNTIETLGGGSARCMIAEIHLPLQSQA